MNKQLAGLLVIAGVALSSVAQAQEVSDKVYRARMAGMCSASHIMSAAVLKESDPRVAIESMQVEANLNSRWGRDPEYKKMYSMTIEAVSKIAKQGGDAREVGRAIALANKSSCPVVGAPEIQLR